MEKAKSTSKVNLANGLKEGLKYLEAILQLRLSEQEAIPDAEIIPIRLPNDNSPWVNFIREQQPTLQEYVVLLLALAPHLEADFFDKIIQEHFPNGSHFPAFGGIRGKNHRGILPTGETAQYVLAGADLSKRLSLQKLFTSEHWFAQKGILHLENVPLGEPQMSGRLIIDNEWLEQMCSGQVSAPRFSTSFPAERLSTHLNWEDLVLPSHTLKQVKELLQWVQYHNIIQEEWQLQRHLKPGYRALFYGPPGTGKTLTTTLLGQSSGKEVYRIDLSMVVSKYIGETEKNLAALFDKASNKNWILFFDEADALFGKRTEVRDAHDKYANQEVSYLLQRVETYPGLVILASNFRKNLDEAFARRFQSIIHFPFPNAEQRLKLWQKIMPKEVPIDPEIKLELLAQQYELNGSNLVNVMQFCSLQLLARGEKELSQHLVLEGIKREFAKEQKRV